MTLPPFAIGEWLACPACGTVCDAPFQPPGSDATEPELVLGLSLPETDKVPSGNWCVEVSAECPACGLRLSALAEFEGRTLREFKQATDD